MTDMAGPAGEQERLLHSIVGRFGVTVPYPMYRAGQSSVVLTAGAEAQDDCAVLAVDGSLDLVLGTDYVRGVKFDLYQQGLLSLFDLGYYLIAANVSDVAAMGASALAVLSVLRYPSDMPDSDFHDVLEGIASACADFSVVNVGGDIGSAERLILSATAIGACSRGRSLRRNSLRPGDRLYLSGPVGVAAAASAWFSEARSDELAQEYVDTLLAAWRRPRAEVALGRMLGEFDGITACMDTSDGLGATLQELARQSSVAIDIWEDRIPIVEAIHAVSEVLRFDAVQLALSASVDFRLLFGVAEGASVAFEDVVSSQWPELCWIGTVGSGKGVRVNSRREGPRPLLAFRWDHREDAGGYVKQLTDHVLRPE